MTAEGSRLLEEVDVSRETLERLKRYATLLEKWNSRINLVSKSTVDGLWTRHMLDSAQLLSILDAFPPKLTDLGSGGGFPGAVIAILLAERSPGTQVQLIEADKRKAEFLRTVSRETETEMSVVCGRIEELPPSRSDIVTARALAPLKTLLSYAERHLISGGLAIFPKGENVETEISEALESWRFRCETYPSKTDTNSVILKVEDIERA